MPALLKQQLQGLIIAEQQNLQVVDLTFLLLAKPLLIVLLRVQALKFSGSMQMFQDR